LIVSLSCSLALVAEAQETGAVTPISKAGKLPVDYVNPFIGTTNYGTTNPGAVLPRGMMSVTPFNVMGESDANVINKDSTWWSTPYEIRNQFLTGFSHVNLSGVGCPELGSLLLMPTAGPLEVDYNRYGSLMSDSQRATPGYYSAELKKYGIRCDFTVTPRTSRARFTFPGGESHILLNLGEGLTNESGATVRFVNDHELEGSKLLGTFCYNPQAVFPIYFVVRVHRSTDSHGYWKLMRPMGVEAQWDSTAGTRKIYTNYDREMSGDDIGAWFTFNASAGEKVEVSVGVSFVSIANARENLDREQPAGTTFVQLVRAAYDEWNKELSKIEVGESLVSLVQKEGENCTEDSASYSSTDTVKTVFYTALYHTMLHPNILQDCNGDYPMMESGRTAHTTRNRYTVFSLWDSYRNLHQLVTLLSPDVQTDMIRSMLDMYREHGWLPKWELYSRETYTMEGAPAIPVIVDSWLKGLRDFDVNLAYEAMRKGATTPGAENPLRPDNDDYMSLGYVPMSSQYDNSVSHALEYYVADNALSIIADSLGHHDDAKLFRKRSLGYKHYFRKDFGTLCPITREGHFYEPFNPKEGENFQPSPGFHEGNAWNYTFFVPHDIDGLCKLMGGPKKFVNHLQSVFDNGNYDPANEPDIAYPYLFSSFKGEEWRTQKLTRELIARYFTNSSGGIPGNDDTGTMSAWAVFTMMGFYPDCPGEPYYTFTSPLFPSITLHLSDHDLHLQTVGRGNYIKRILIDGRPFHSYRISHKQLTSAHEIVFEMRE
jgi:predicted alpha-1,2-mannosidase